MASNPTDKLLNVPIESPTLPQIDSNNKRFITNNNNGSFISSLKDNPYFSAGFGLVGIGALLSILKQLTNLSYTVLRKRYTISLEVVSRDKSYDWLLKWIDLHLKQRSQHISVATHYEKNENNDRITTNFSFLPSLGTHYFYYKKHWIRAERSREQTIDRLTGFPVETLKLDAFGRNVNIFNSLLEESRQKAVKDLVGKTSIFTVLGTDWKQFGHSNLKRPFKSVVLDKGIAENLLNDIKDFLNNSKWYQERGIPYRRGYLLYGPPGCGKTSFITALAGEIDYDIAIANLSDRSLSDDRLNVLFSKAPLRSIVLLEDIDAAFKSREIETKEPGRFEGMARLTLSGLLNTLDGVAESHGRIVFMTTNYIDRLDPALIRPGRVDVRQYVGHMTEYQIHKMFLKFYPNANEKKIEAFSKKLVEMNKKMSPAIMQGYFMLCKNDPDKALENIDFFKTL